MFEIKTFVNISFESDASAITSLNFGNRAIDATELLRATKH